MRSFATLLLFFVLLSSASAKTYYFSASGDDSRSATQAQNQSTPWKSIAKLNSIFSILQPGDKVLFKRGDTFYGSIKITKSGTTSAPITIGAYGSGDRPIITGFLTLSKWTSIGSGKYECYNSALGTIVNTVSVNGVATEMGRYPNSNATDKGYRYFESHGTNSITDNELSSSPDWTGAELVIRTRHWIIDRVKVTDQSGRTLKYSPATTYTPYDDYGYFIQNDIRTLDRLGEWYYKPSTKKFYMYFGGSSPSNYKVKAGNIKEVIYNYNQDNITLDNLTIEGANEKAVYIYSANNVKVQNCDLLLSGIYGVWAQNTNNLHVENSNIINTNNIGILLYANTNNSVIRGNIIKNTGVFAGMGQNKSNQCIGIHTAGDHNLIEYNEVDGSGFCGIRFSGDYITVKNNFVKNFNTVRDDGGGIYTSSQGSDAQNYGRKIIGNIILNGIGAKEGTTNKSFQTASGIYIDNDASGITISDNTISNCGKVGLYIHNSFKITITNNTCYNNTSQALLNHDSQLWSTLRSVTLKNNIFVSKTTDQKVAMFYTRDNDIAYFGKFDSNYYARPIDDNVTIEEITGLYVDGKQVKRNHTLDTWKDRYNIYDLRSKKSPKTFSSTVDPNKVIRFEYNASKTSKTITLNATYVDVKKKYYSGTITLAPYASLVLIYTGTTTETALADSTASSTLIEEAAPEKDTIAQKPAAKETIAQKPFDFRVYPNPATNKIFVELTSSTQKDGDGKATMIIQNMSGGTVRQMQINVSNNRMEVDLSSLSSGMYVISISTGNTVISRKFIKAN